MRLWPLLSGNHWDLFLAANGIIYKKINLNLINQTINGENAKVAQKRID